MELRSQKAIGVILALLPALAATAELSYRVRHERLLRDKPGTLVVDDSGVGFLHLRWNYEDIQELRVGQDKVVVVTYADRKWRLGLDQEYEFALLPDQDLRPVYEMLKDKLDRRFVAMLADPDAAALWSLPAKLTGTLRGSEGVLKVGPDRIVYETARKGHSRTWRYPDIENVSSSDPYELTITTFERSKLHYGSRRSFTLQLKQPLGEDRYQLLWRRLQRHAAGSPVAAQDRRER